MEFFNYFLKDFISLLGILTFIYYLLTIILGCITDCDLALAFAERFGNSKDILKDKVIWITGASSGIGEYLAIQCAALGAKVALTARREDNLNIVKQKCIDAGGKLENVYLLPFDLLDTKLHKTKFDEVINYFGKLDILINNAGRTQRANWENIDLVVDQQVFDLNVFSVISLSRIAVKYFIVRGEGHIAVTSSVGGFFAVPFSASYIAAKHAIQGYFKSLMVEKIGTNLNVTLFCPGPILTGYLEESFTEKNGEKYGIAITAKEKRMTSDRCAHLFLVALANKLEIAWACLFPFSILTYLSFNFPNLQKKILSIIGIERMHRLRGG